MILFCVAGAIAVCLSGVAAVIVAVSRTMTLCLTFDDGFKVHADIAAPMIEEFGWRAVFNIPTQFVETPRRALSAAQLFDCRLSGTEDAFMTLDDVKKLAENGHEIYPHTLDHSDLKVLEEKGEYDEASRQVADSKARIKAVLGFVPLFFCSPHNSNSRFIRKLIHENGMEIVSCARRNFPRSPAENPPVVSIRDYLAAENARGLAHVDIMVHGIDKAHGGWEPFDNVEDFRRFLLDIKQSEDEGLVKVVSYLKSHRPYTLYGRLARQYDRVLNKIRRVVRCSWNHFK